MRILTILIIILTTSIAFAQPKQGFSGYVEGGIFAASSNDALDASGEKEIDSITDNPSSKTSVAPVLIFDVNYGIVSKNLNIHFGVPKMTAEPKIYLGVTKYFADKSSFDISLIAKPMKSVWEDPYLNKRKETDEFAGGISLSYDNIAGSGFSAEIESVAISVDDDKLGDRISSMKRDGSETSVSLSKKVSYDKNIIVPQVKYTLNDRDGNAQSSSKFGTSISLIRKVSAKNNLFLNAGYSFEKFDETNPIYNKTREDSNIRAAVMYKINAPFGMKDNKYIRLIGGASKRISNIDFYDANEYFTVMTFGVKF